MHLAIALSSAEGTIELGHLAGLVQRAERARLDLALFANPLGAFEASTLVAALSTMTSRIGLVATASMVGYQPYNLARRFASLDIISGGRSGWNTTLVPQAQEAAGFSPTEQLSEKGFRSRAEEFLQVVSGLWQGWDADAMIYDKVAGRFFTPEKMHVLDHKGEHFFVRGPLNVARSPQDRPVVMLSGLAPDDRDCAARTADVVIAPASSRDEAKAFKDDLTRRAAAFDRESSDLKVLLSVAADAAQDGNALKDAGLRLGGSPSHIADTLEHWFSAGLCDGFMVDLPALSPDVDSFFDGVVPEFHRRGLLRQDYEGVTLRSHLGLRAENAGAAR